MKKGYIPKDQRKKILLLCDDMRTHSGIGTVAKEVVLHTAHHFNRVQLHKPAAGRNKLRKADRILDEFMTECFTPKGKYQEKEYPKVVSSMCKWCPFNDDKDLCNKVMSS